MTTTLESSATAASQAVPEADPRLKPVVVSDSDRFLFDLQGFIFLRGALSDQDRRELLADVERLGKLEYDDRHWRKDVPNSKVQATKHVMYGAVRLNGLFRLSTGFDRIIDYPTVFPYLQAFVDEPQILNAWAIAKNEGGGAGGWHRGVGPEQYTARHGRIRSRMLNVVYFLTENTLDNGCMVALPGGHKSNFDLDWGTYRGLDLPGSAAMTGAPGDVLLFSEAVLHNGLASTVKNQTRTNLYFNYGSRDFNVMTYSPASNFHYAMPPHIRARFTPARRQASTWMDYVQTID